MLQLFSGADALLLLHQHPAVDPLRQLPATQHPAEGAAPPHNQRPSHCIHQRRRPLLRLARLQTSSAPFQRLHDLGGRRREHCQSSHSSQCLLR